MASLHRNEVCEKKRTRVRVCRRRVAPRRGGAMTGTTASPPPKRRPEPGEAERRKALSSDPVRSTARAHAPPSPRRPPLHNERDVALRRSTRGDFSRRDRASGARTDGATDPCGIGLHRLPRALARVRPTPSSPCGRPHLVGADGNPGASRTQGANPARGRRRPHSANQTPPEGAPG